MKEDRINVLMAINRSYLEQMKTVICSLGANCSCVVDIYVMHTELTKDDIQKLDYLLRKMCGGNLYEIKMNSDFLKGAKTLSHFSIEMYYRIFASEFLPKTIDRILWLDADLVVLQDIEELFNIDLEGKSIAACGHRERNESNPAMNNAGIERLGLRNDDVYFNSGVLLMDIGKIRENFNKDSVLKLIYENQNILIYPDQDILNLMYKDDKIILDWKKYNFQTHFDWTFFNEMEYIRSMVSIVHYVGPFKPWLYTSSHFSYQYYWKYYFLHGSKFTFYKNEFMKILFSVYMKLKKHRGN